jgi:hypothetical protein
MSNVTRHLRFGTLVFSILLGGCQTGQDAPGQSGVFEKVYGDLLNGGSNPIRVATFDEFQFQKYTADKLEADLLFDEANAVLSDSDARSVFRLAEMKTKSLAYFRYYLGMSESARRCNDIVPDAGILDAASAKEAVRSHLRKRNDCMFGVIGSARIESLFQSRPDMNDKPYRCRVEIPGGAGAGVPLPDSFQIVFDGSESKAPLLNRLIIDKIRSKRYAVHGADDSDSVAYSGRVIRYRMKKPEYDAKYSFSLMPERIFEEIYGDSVNKASVRGWEALKQREKFGIEENLQSVNLKSDSDGVLARAGGRTVLTIRELKEIFKHSPNDSAYLGNLKSYIDFFGIWKLGSEEFDKLKLEGDPYIRAYTSGKSREFLGEYYREKIFSKKQGDSKPKAESWLALQWEGDIQPCKKALAEYSPRGFNLLGELPFEYFKATLSASILSSDSASAATPRCREKINAIGIEAYEISKAAFIQELAVKHPGTTKLFSPFLAHLSSYSDSLNSAQKAHELGNAGLAAKILESLLFRNFSNPGKTCELSLFLARIHIEAGEFDKAAFQLERALLLAPASPAMEQLVKVLLAIYGRDLVNKARSEYWKRNYSAVVKM